MAKNPLGKSRKVDAPFAVYRAGAFTWHVLKTYQSPEAERKNAYARWLVAAKSPATWGSWEYGDTYAAEVRRHGRLVAADPAFAEAYGVAGLPTPAEHYASEAAQ